MNFCRLERSHPVDRFGLSHAVVYVFIFLLADWNQVGAILVVSIRLITISEVLFQFHCLLDCVQTIAIVAIDVFYDLHSSICLS